MLKPELTHKAGQTRMKVDENWQSGIVTEDILSFMMKENEMSVLTIFSLQ